MASVIEYVIRYLYFIIVSLVNFIVKTHQPEYYIDPVVENCPPIEEYSLAVFDAYNSEMINGDNDFSLGPYARALLQLYSSAPITHLGSLHP